LFPLKASGNGDGAAMRAMAEIEPSGIEGTADAHALAGARWENAEADVETEIAEV
jgi:hypothetical protein